MGYIRHHSVVVTSWNYDTLKKAHDRASTIFKDTVSQIVRSDINDYHSFFIAPDGSKEGWDDSKIGDTKREAFVRFINEQAYEDGSNSLAYCEFFYGDDNGEAKIVNHN